MLVLLKSYPEHAANAPFVYARRVGVGEAAHVFNVEEFEDVVDAGYDLDVRLFIIHSVRGVGVRAVGVEVSGEVEEAAVSGVALEEGVVFLRERAPQHVAGDVFAPFQLFEQGDAVEDFAVHVPRNHQRGVAVVEKLHVVDEFKHVVLLDVREVGGRHDEHGVGHLVPLHAAFEIRVYLAPRPEPEAFVNARLGEVVGIGGAAEGV